MILTVLPHHEFRIETTSNPCSSNDIIQLSFLVMPTDREKREISKLAMAKKRKEKEKIKKLKEQGLCVYQGEVIPVMEARKRGGQLGASHGVKGKESGVKGKESGVKGKEYGVMGEEYVSMGKEYGVMGKEYGVKGKGDGFRGKEFGIKGAEHGKKCPKEAQYIGQVSSLVLRIERAAEKFDTVGEPPIQVNKLRLSV